MNDISIIILTMNEEKNILECVKSASEIAKEIFIVDSGSNDKTCEIARDTKCHVVFNEFVDYATQFNWALDNLPIKTKWVMRLDADERLTPELCNEIKYAIKEHEKDDINGFVIKLKTYFMNRCLMHGGVYPFRKLMLFKYGVGRIEQRKMDEHTVLSRGESIELSCDGLHYDFKDLDSYIRKHNWYATREAQDYLENSIGKGIENLSEGQLKTRRKEKMLYYKLPIFFRPFMLFVYYYFFRLGFLDGKEGLIYNFLGVWWYRFLVDSKIYEYKKTGKKILPTGALK